MKRLSNLLLIKAILFFSVIVALIFLLNRLVFPIVHEETILSSNEKWTEPPQSLKVKNEYNASLDPSFHKGDSLFKEGKFETAIIQYRELSKEFLLKKDWEKYVHSINKIASSHINNYNFDSAIANLERASETGSKEFPVDHPVVGDTYFLFGQYYDFTNNPENSIDFHLKSLRIRKNAFGENDLKVAESFKGLGDVYYYIFRDYLNAEKYYKQSLNIRENSDSGSQAELIKNYYVLASIYRKKNDYDLAIIFGTKALEVSEHILERRSYYVSFCLGLLANIHNHLKDYDKAIDLYHQAIQVEKQNENNSQTLSEHNNNLGFCYTNRKEFNQARFFLKKALTYNASQNTTDSIGLLLSYYNLGWFYSEFNQYDSARYYYDKCLKGRIKIFGVNSLNVAEVYEDLGMLYEKTNNLGMSLQMFRKALKSFIVEFNFEESHSIPLISEKNYRPELLELIMNIANIYRKLYLQDGLLVDLKCSLEYYKLGDFTNDLSRNSFQMENSKLFMEEYYESEFEKGIQVASLLYDLTKDQNYLNQVYTFIEKGKYIILYESLQDAERYSKAGIDRKIKEQENNLLVQTKYYRNEIEKEGEKEKKETKRIKMLQQKEYKLNRMLDGLKERLSKEYPNYYQIKYERIEYNLKDIHAYLKSTNSQIIELYWGDSLLYVLSIDEDTTKLASLKHEEIGLYNEKYLNLLSKEINVSFADFQSYQESAFEIYEQVLKPHLRDKTNNKKPKNLIIIPDGPLARIPFEGLVTAEVPSKEVDYKNLDYLIKNYSISYAYSSQLLLKSKNARDKVDNLNLIAFSYTREDENPGNEGSKKQMQELQGAAREIQSLASIANGAFFSGKEATEENFKAHASKYNIIHLALHGASDLNNIGKSKLIFKKDARGKEDGNLHSYELYNLNLKSQLVVLSACETGQGKQVKGEGIYSMARGFAYAGCPSIVMSLWKVNDFATSELISEFYQQLSQGVTLNDALRNSKINYLENSDSFTAHPSNWASFVALGETAPLELSKGYLRWMLFALGSIVLFVFLFFFVKNQKVNRGKKWALSN